MKKKHTSGGRSKRQALPKSVARRIMERCARGDAEIVVVNKKRKPTSVFGFDEYVKMQQLPLSVQAVSRPSDALPSIDAGIASPVKRKRVNTGKVPDPLGAVKGNVLSSLSRSEIYD